MSEETKVFKIPVTFDFKVVTIDKKLRRVFLGENEIDLPEEVKGQEIDIKKMEDDIANPPGPQPHPPGKPRPEHPPIYAYCVPFRRPDGTIYYWHCIPGGNKSC